LVSWRTIASRTSPFAFAGHSFGEITALAAAGALSVRDALELVVARGRLTQQVASATPGGMLALLGVDLPNATAIAERCGLAVANDNCPGQVVLSGPTKGLDQAEDEARAIKSKFARLRVDGPFHSPWMAEAANAFAAELARVEFAPPASAVFSGLTARPFEDVPAQLAQSLVSGVRWREVIEALEGSGATRYVEVAPGKVLSNMVRRILPEATIVTLDRERYPD
jgi:[acyl-carrier-protein] S-malonyltransferase